VVVAIAENGRVPVDNPATHLELTMVHEAMLLEYSGRHLALIEWAASLKLMLYISMIACIFIPFGLAGDTDSPLGNAVGISSWLLKMAVLGTALGISETAVAKMRVFRVPNYLGAALMLGLLGVLLLFVSQGM
jgi:formate hydrogenlyase subunit 4